jgi:two-component system cell cycle response regulator DivK
MSNALILIVEDDEKNMKLIRHLLQFKGYKTLEAMTAGAGIDLAKAHHPDLILMDIQLPDFDGITALTRLRADPATSDIKVMAVSASVMPEDRSRVLNAGFNGFQGKPIKLTEFSAAVAAMLAGTSGNAA